MKTLNMSAQLSTTMSLLAAAQDIVVLFVYTRDGKTDSVASCDGDDCGVQTSSADANGDSFEVPSLYLGRFEAIASWREFRFPDRARERARTSTPCGAGPKCDRRSTILAI